MQLQIHVENAIDHGLRNRSAGDTVRISFARDDNYVYLAVEDEGAGETIVRQRQEKIGDKPGVGTRVLNDLHAIFNQYNDRPIITKRSSPIFPAKAPVFGTRVEIQIPTDYTYEIERLTG